MGELRELQEEKERLLAMHAKRRAKALAEKDDQILTLKARIQRTQRFIAKCDAIPGKPTPAQARTIKRDYESLVAKNRAEDAKLSN